jgi:hypothetical protein
LFRDRLDEQGGGLEGKDRVGLAFRGLHMSR